MFCVLAVLEYIASLIYPLQINELKKPCFLYLTLWNLLDLNQHPTSVITCEYQCVTNMQLLACFYVSLNNILRLRTL